MIQAKDTDLMIGGVKLKLSDLRGFVDSAVILANGMKIRATDFEIKFVKKQLEQRASDIIKAGLK